MDKSLITVVQNVVFYNNEKFGNIVYDSYFNAWRSSHDNYKVEFGTQDAAVMALVEFTLKELTK